MRYLVLGSGMMGSAAAYDLATTDPESEVVLADRDYKTAARSARAIGPNVQAYHIDVLNAGDLVRAMKGCNVVLSAAPYDGSVLVDVVKVCMLDPPSGSESDIRTS